MASTDNEVPAPIIVKKIKKGGHGHHGGAWKVAYADFVTAMMAFFLLMWLLNVTTKEEKNAISNYFDPTHPKVSSSESGAGGILGGLTVTFEGAMTSDKQPPVTPPDATTPNTGRALGDQQNRQGAEDLDSGSDATDASALTVQGTTEESADQDQASNGINILEEAQKAEQEEIEKLREMLEAQQNEKFEEIKKKIFEEIEKSPELADLKDNLMIDITPEGLRIQIVDAEGRSMFPSGKASMFDFMRELVTKVTQVIVPQPNQISMRGHTDSSGYREGATYDNWNLSADRALATRTVMVANGLPAKRIETVVGRADREHLLPDEPFSPRNRRISVVLLRGNLLTDEAVKKAAKEAGLDKKKEDNLEPLPAPTPETNQSGEDRENIPELDQTIEPKQPNITDDTKAAEEATDIVDEMKKFQEQQRQKNRRVIIPKAPAEPKSEGTKEMLEF